MTWSEAWNDTSDVSAELVREIRKFREEEGRGPTPIERRALEFYLDMTDEEEQMARQFLDRYRELDDETDEEIVIEMAREFLDHYRELDDEEIRQRKKELDRMDAEFDDPLPSPDDETDDDGNV